jgi:peroxiredoxin
MSRPYSGIPAQGRRTWIVPRWLKEAFVAFALVALAVVAASKLVQHFGGKAARAASAIDADEMPAVGALDFSLPTRDGKKVDLSAYRGKVVLLNFWATWCPPCREEEPSLRKLSESVDPSSFAVVAVSVDEGGWPEIDKFFGRNAPPYAVVLDEGARISQRYGTSRFPESYLIDQNGTMRLKFIGARNWTDPNVFTLLESMGAKRKG